MQSVYITTKAASSNPAYCDVYSIQHYVIQFVSDLRPPPIKLSHNLTETLLKLTLSTTVQPPPLAMSGIRTHTTLLVIGMDCTGSCKSIYHTITITTTPIGNRYGLHR